MEEAMNDHHNTEPTVAHSPAEITTHQELQSHSQTCSREDIENVDKDSTKQSCYYKPLSPPIVRQRKQNISMFEAQPMKVREITEVQEICIETGGQQYVKKSLTVLPELTSCLPICNQCKSLTGLLTDSLISKTSEDKSEAYARQMTETPIVFRGSVENKEACQDLCKVVIGKDNAWMGLGSKCDIPRIPSCPVTPPTSPSIRRRSVGVLMSPAWGLRTFRDPDKSASPALRRGSLVLPGRHVQAKDTPNSFARKSLVSPDVTELTTHKDWVNNTQLSKSTEDLTKPSREHQLDFGNENNSQDQSQRTINNEVTEKQNNVSSDDEFEDFRPRLRSHSLDDYRSQARDNILQNRQRPQLHEPDKRKQSRRKSFEVWLGEKEQETIKRIQMLALEKQRTAEGEAKRKEQRKGKTYEEWLNDKTNMATVKCCSEKQDETTKIERQEAAKRRYDKWLMEKETKALEKEKEMLELARLKTIKMRKEQEEKKKNRLKFMTRSLFS